MRHSDVGRGESRLAAPPCGLEPGGAFARHVGRVFAALNGRCFERCFIAWMKSLCPSLAGLELAVDGKTLRRSHARALGVRAIHMVSAFADRLGLTVGQLKTEEKSNEITAIALLLEALLLKGAVISIDAMGNQRAIAAQIIEA